MLKVTTDLMTFNTTRKPGFLEYTKEMLQLGAQLGQNFTKTLTCESVKSLLPHPTSISNAINNIASRKKEFYAFLRNETKTSGMAVMIDGTSKTYHYTAIVITFIDINWQLKNVLCDLIVDENKGGQSAEYAVTKIKEFLAELEMKDINAINTDEAAAMKAAFHDTEQHIICICHLCSTISKHSHDLYAADKKEMPELDKLLSKIRDLLQKLKDVVALIRSRIYIREKLNNTVHQSNATRWLSTLTSVESFLALDEDDHRLIHEELKNHASFSKYLDLKAAKEDLKSIFDVLHPVRHLLRSFEVEKSPTLQLVIPGLAELYNHFNNVVDSNNWIEVSMKRAAKLAIQEKVPVLHVYHYFAVLLDPNAKSKIVTYILPDRKGNKKQILELMDGLKVAVYNYAVNSGKYQPPQAAIVDDDCPFASLIQSPEDDFKQTINSEIDRYLLDKETYSTSLLGYWKNALNYPYLSYFSKFLFSILASSSPVERSFKVLNKIDNKDRPQLDQETISNIVISNAIDKFFKI